MPILKQLDVFFSRVRHSTFLSRIDPLWNFIRPIYWKIRKCFPFERVINGTDRMRLTFESKSHPEYYEADFWSHLLSEVKNNDVIADVGANVGIYTVALGRRVAQNGAVIAFEPGQDSFLQLQKHVKMNLKSSKNIELVQAAVGSLDGTVQFKESGWGGHVTSASNSDTNSVRCLKLDTYFASKKIDILKIDVEGYEEEVLKGADSILNDVNRCPRVIHIEVHPHLWEEIGTTSESLLRILSSSNYELKNLEGMPTVKIEQWKSLVAMKRLI